MLRSVRIRSLDLDEAFRADLLFTASSGVEIRGIVKEADRAFRCIFVEVNFNGLAIDKGVVRKLDFFRGHIGLSITARRSC